MKPKALFLTFLMAAVIQAYSQNTFLKTYQFREGSLYDYTNVTGATYNPMYPGAIFVSFYQSDYNETYAGHQSLLVLDTAGNILKTITYFVDNPELVEHSYFRQSIYINNNGDMYLSSAIDGQNYLDRDGLIMKVDTNNNVWFSQKISSYNGGGYDYGITSAKTLNISSIPPLFVAGAKDKIPTSTNNDDQGVFLARIDDANGQIIDYTAVEISGYSVVPTDFFLLPSGNIALWGTAENAPSSNRLYLFDTTLTLLYAPVSYSYNNFDFYNSGSLAIFTSNFNQINSGICVDAAGKYQVYCYSITSTGNVNWAKVYSFETGFNPTSKPQVKQIIEKDSSLYILIDGSLKTPYHKGDFMIMNINKYSGALNWVKYQGTNYRGTTSYDMDANAMLLIDSNIYIVGSYSKLSDDNSVFLIKTDLSGNWSDNCYDNRNYGTLTTIDATINNSNLLFSLDTSFAGTIFGTQVQIFPDTVAEEIKPPVASAVVPASVCQNNVLTLTDQSANHYSWNYRYKDCGFWQNSGNADMPPLTTDASNFLYCTGLDSVMIFAYDVVDNWNNTALCVDTAYYTVNVIPQTLNAGFTFTAGGLTYQFTDTTTGTIRWLWDFGDGNSDTIPNPQHTYSATGSYTVCLTAWSPCDSATVCQTVTVTGINNSNLKNNIQLYPNPANNELIVKGITGKARITFYDINGKIVEQFQSVSGAFKIDVSSWSEGMYIAEILTRKYIRKIPLIINR